VLLVVGFALVLTMGIGITAEGDPFSTDWSGVDRAMIGAGLGLVGLLVLVGSAFVTRERREDVRVAERDST
jgi:hypothetical protein